MIGFGEIIDYFGVNFFCLLKGVREWAVLTLDLRDWTCWSFFEIFLIMRIFFLELVSLDLWELRED